MKKVLLTITGPANSMDLAVSGELPVADLIAPLLKTGLLGAEEASRTRWVLTLGDGQPLALERSLTESGVVDGQVLRLRPQSAGPEAPRGPGPATEPMSAGSPLTRRREMLPTEPTLSERLLGRRDRYAARLDTAIRGVVLGRCATIAVVSPKGGVGKSTVSVLLASLLSRLRADRVVVVDADSDYGSLGPWLAPSHAFSVNELAAGLEQPGYLSGAVEEHLAVGPEGLLLCPAPRDAGAMAALDRDRYGRLLARLQDRPGILILDCGTGLGQPGVQAAILASEQIVLVSDGDPATLDLVAGAAGLLRHAGPPITVVVNRTRLAASDAAQADAMFPYASALLGMSDDTHAARLLSSNGFSWDAAPRSWQREARELAAILAAQWPQLHLGELGLPPES